MTERSIVEAADRLRKMREPHLVATVMSVQGSAYRRPGARMLLTQFRWITGSVTGGCLEGDLAKIGWTSTQDGAPLLLTYDASFPADADDDIRSAFGLGCADGVVDVLVERAGVPGRIDPLDFACECIRGQRRGAIVTVFRSSHDGAPVGSRLALRAGEEAIAEATLDPALLDPMLADARRVLESGESCNRMYPVGNATVEVFVEAILPPPRLFVFGTGHDAVPVVALARTLGWDVTICAPDIKASTRTRFSNADEIIVGSAADLAARVEECDRAVAVVMSHHYEIDREHLGMLVGTHVRYIGVLGPRSRSTRMLNELCISAHDDARIHAPVGLELGAETPQEIAVAIVAEIQAALNRALGSNLRERLGPIHDRQMPRIAEALERITDIAV